MSKIAFSPNDSGTGTFTIESPPTNDNRTLELPDESGTIATVESIFPAIQQEVSTRITGNTTIRQTVLSGPIDSDGRADFLQSGSGLEVSTFGISSSEPLQITLGDGFNIGEQRNIGVSIENNLTWSGLPDNEDEVFLILEIDGSSITPTHTILEPEYNQTRPNNPGQGQLFYPIDHRHQMERYDGNEWKRNRKWVVVGECATSGGSVVDIISYAYQGTFFSESNIIGSSPTQQNISHNVGAKNKSLLYTDLVFGANSAFVSGQRCYIDTYFEDSNNHGFTLASGRTNALITSQNQIRITVVDFNDSPNSSWGLFCQRDF